MKISAKSGRRWRLADSQRAGSGSLPNHRSAAVTKAIACKRTPSPTSTTKFPWPPFLARRGGRLIANLELEFRVTRSKQSTEAKSNRKKIAILQTDFSVVLTPSPFSNRNSRFTGFHSTCSKRATKQISNRNKNGISAVSASLARHAFLSASLPPRLAATRCARYNSGSHIEVNQP
jgi:hypothetical protein